MNLRKNAILLGLIFIVAIVIFVILLTVLKVLRNKANRKKACDHNKKPVIEINKNNDIHIVASNISHSENHTAAPCNELKNLPEYIPLEIEAKFIQIHISLLDRLEKMIPDVTTFEGNEEDLPYGELRNIICPGIIKDINIAGKYFSIIEKLTYKYGCNDALYYVKTIEPCGHLTQFKMTISMFSPLSSVVKMRFIPYLAIINEKKEFLIAVICNDVGIACGIIMRDRIFEKVDQ